MNLLVTGGAGYVGSIVTEELLKSGHKVTVLDNLQQGHRKAVSPGAELVVADFSNEESLNSIFKRFPVDAVVHMAAETVVEFSVSDPKRYFVNNVAAGITLLTAMIKHEVKQLIFSSSAAVYGEPQTTPIMEDHATVPVNSYGESKLMFERILAWYQRAYGLNYIAFRYFNAAGASESIGEDHRPETHLIPNILTAALLDKPVSVFGTDYPTRDGSCIRDYVHVLDIAQAHVLALRNITRFGGRIYNVGSQEGYSVLEIIAGTEKVTGRRIRRELQPRRAGDPAVLLAGSNRLRTELGWQPMHSDIEQIIESAWKWMKRNPKGYE